MLSLLTFSNQKFNYSKNMLIRSAKKFGIESIYAYSDKDFQKTEFYKQHIKIASQPRGAGYWIWKPYYILEHLRNAKEGEILVYCDSGLKIVSPLDDLLTVFEESSSTTGIMLFHNYQSMSYMHPEMEKTLFNQTIESRKNRYWGKRDAFVLMGMDEERYWDSPQLEGCFGVFKKTDFSIKFLEEWLFWCCNEHVLTDSVNSQGKENLPNFVMHIHDQLILSLLAEKYRLNLFRCASQFGNHLKLPQFRKHEEFCLLPYLENPEVDSKFGTILDHHRTKRMPFPKQQIFDLKVFLKEKLNKTGVKW
jgi:hypothetical protein